jgi:hypothetical protein
LVGHWPGEPGGDVSSVVVRDGYAFCATGRRGLVVLDVRGPRQPRRVGGNESSSSLSHIHVAGSIAYAVRDEYLREAYDAQHPANPTRLLSTYSACLCHQRFRGIGAGSSKIVYAKDTDSANGVASASLVIMEPVTPLAAGTEPTPWVSPNSWNFEIAGHGGPVAVDGDIVFWLVVGSGSFISGRTELIVVDIVDPANPRQLSRTKVSAYQPRPQAIVVQDKQAFCLSYRQQLTANEGAALDIVDVREPSQPRRIGGIEWWNDDREQISFGMGHGLAVQGNLAFVADGLFGLRVIDVSNPAVPVQVVLADTGGIAKGVFVAGDYAYVANGDRGLAIFDIAALAKWSRLVPQGLGTNRAFTFTLTGATNQVLRIQRSENLRDWQDWKAFTSEDAPLPVTDPDAASATARFYRAVSP